MNTVLTPCSGGYYEMDDGLCERVVESLAYNNTFVPNIDRVVFNTKTEDTVAKTDADGKPVVGEDGRIVRETVTLPNPVLVTVVYFADGTKVTVKNSERDGITLADEKVKLSDGTEKTVRTASVESREIGLVYALAKRIVCTYDDDGNIGSQNFAKFLRGTIKAARMQDVESVRTSEERRILRARAKAAAAKPKKERRPGGFAEQLKRLSEVIDRLRGTVSGDGETED